MRGWMRGMIGVGCVLLGTLHTACLLPPPDNNNNQNSNVNTNSTGGNTNTNGALPQNQAPTANAGADQSVERGEDVQLDATASSDPDGDALSFAWTQVSGAAVTLANANGAMPTFTAPNIAGDLVFQVQVSDNKGGVASDTVQVTIEGASGVLYVANNDSGRVTVHRLSELNGEIAPFVRIDPGATTSLFQVRSLIATPGGGLFASRQNGGVVVYGDNLLPTGDRPAAAIWDGPLTLLDAPISLAYEPSQELLFVGNVSADDGILVFDTESGDGGNVGPIRKFAPPDRAPFDNVQMTIDALWLRGGELFASDTSGLNANSSRILVFANPTSADGEVTPARVITSASFGNIEDLTVDQDNVLYVVDGTNVVKVFDNANTLDGAATPVRTITINAVPTPSLQGIALSSDGTGYIADRENSAIYSIHGIGARDGVVVPDASLSGFDTRLSGPRQIVVLENDGTIG